MSTNIGINSFVLLSSLLLVISSYVSAVVDINTTSGVVRGQTIHIQTKLLDAKIDQWLGIPYAEPPVGDLRFTYPVPYKYRKDVIDATKAKSSCMQPFSETERHLYGDLTLSEDCLFINIWRPTSIPPTNKQEAASRDDDNLKPVMFWIHGGSLKTGSIFGKIYNGSALAAQGVVVVSVNYRLGQFGFLFGDSEQAPGNVGFYDQLLGMKWVRDNIQRFGGDRDRVTIFGQSAGSWSVMEHILSPKSKGLFRRAIMQSGSLMYNKDRDVVSKPEALKVALEIAVLNKCFDPNQWIQCLRRVSADQLTKLTGSLAASPVYDTPFLPMRAQLAFEKNLYNSDIDLMAGVTAGEGHELVKLLLDKNSTVTVVGFKLAVQLLSNIYHNIDVNKISDFYLKNISPWDSPAMLNQFGKLAGDLILKCPTYLFAKQLAAKHLKPETNVYFYELTYGSQWFDQLIGCNPKVDGVCHSSDIPFVWGLPLLDPVGYTQDDYTLAQWTLKWWTDFAKTGKLDSNWAQMLSATETNVKDWNPRNITKMLEHVFDDTCDGVWKSYFL
ncbi:acetylcholinesterase-1-like [Oppia nitens]|uniref:acetylcholinesterase-1-like n=1 Tax=Oppia nitens TaxID=1686743 RepID=UPI0023DAE076|nr:acetylcholinesterase-1-like [Oppia nitens]